MTNAYFFDPYDFQASAISTCNPCQTGSTRLYRVNLFTSCFLPIKAISDQFRKNFIHSEQLTLRRLPGRAHRKNLVQAGDCHTSLGLAPRNTLGIYDNDNHFLFYPLVLHLMFIYTIQILILAVIKVIHLISKLD